MKPIDTIFPTNPIPRNAAKHSAWKRLISRLSPNIQSGLLFFCVLFSVQFLFLLSHEGGHALADVFQGHEIRLLYVHPFYFSGYARANIYFDRVLNHAAGPFLGMLVPLLIFIPLWKRRSVVLLPLLMFFPWAAIETGTNVTQISQTGDYFNIIRLTGLPEAVITVPCLVLLFVGMFFFVFLLPLLGLSPKDWRTLLALPAAVMLWSGASILAAHLVVPGSPIDVIYYEGADVIQTAEGVWPRGVLLVMLLAIIYLTLYRLLYPRLPSWLKSGMVQVCWSDLRIPALAAAACVIVGVILIR